MKKNNLGAKITIGILLLMIIGIGLLKFIDYLEGPADNFFDAFDSIALNIENASKILDNDLYSLFKDKGQINVDTKITATNTYGTVYNDYKNLLESSSFITTLKFDKSMNYLSANLKATKSNLAYELNYIENDKDRYLKENDNLYEAFNVELANLKMFDINLYPKIIEIIKNVLKKHVSNHDVLTTNNNITINNLSYDTNVSSIIMNEDEVKGFLDGLTEVLIDDEDISKYLNVIHNINDIETMKKKLYDLFNIEENASYVINVFNNSLDNEIVKFSFGGYAKTPTISYECLMNYYTLKLGEKTYKLIGTKDNMSLTIDSDKKITFTYKGSASSFSGTFLVEKADVEEIKIEYNVETQKSSNTSISTSIIIKLYPTIIKKDMIFEFNSSALIDKNVTINKTSISNPTSSNKTTLKEYIDICLKHMKNYLEIAPEE